MWTTNSGFADLFTIFAKVDGEKFSAFLVERGTPGLSVGPEEHKLGIRGSSTCPLILSDCQIPVENLLGEIGKGHHIAFNILNIGRFKLGAACVGGAKNSLQEAIRYAKERKAFGKSISEFGLIQEKLAECATGIFAGESLVYRTIGMIDAALADVDPAAEQRLLASARKLTLFAAGVASQKYMQALADQQEVMAALADCIMEAYALESCLLRTEKLIAAKGEAAAKQAIAMTRYYGAKAIQT